MTSLEENRERIILVEDSKDWAVQIKKVAHEMGAQVTHVSKYNQAVEMLEKGIERYSVAIFDSRLGDNSPKLGRLVQYVEERDGDFKPSPIALTQYPQDVSNETKSQLVATLDKSDVRDNPKKLKQGISVAFRDNAKRRGFYWWRYRIRDLPIPKTRDDLVRGFPFALSRVQKRYRNQGLCIHRRLIHHFNVNGIPSFDCAGYVMAIHDGRVEVAMEIELGKEIFRAFNVDRFRKTNLLFPGATFRYQVFEEANGDVRSHLEPWDYPKSGKIDYDPSVFRKFDATKKIN